MLYQLMVKEHMVFKMKMNYKIISIIFKIIIIITIINITII